METRGWVPVLCILVVFQAVRGEKEPPPYIGINVDNVDCELPKLPFNDNELEPYLDEKTVVAHHRGHHATYTKNTNKLLAKLRKENPNNDLAHASILKILQNIDKVPSELRQPLKNQGGGYVNHCFYWATMSKNPSSIPRKPWGELAEEIDLYFGNYSNFVEEFNNAAKGLFGSGYVWLNRQLVQRTAENAPLIITTTANQDSPVSEKMLPILVLDVWEHAYYLKHQYKRPDYITDWWNVVDWDAVHKLDLWWKSGALVAKDEL